MSELYKIELEVGGESKLNDLSTQLAKLAGSSTLTLAVNAVGAEASLAGLQRQYTTQIASINQLKGSLKDLHSAAGSETDPLKLGQINSQIVAVEGQLKNLKSITHESLNPAPADALRAEMDKVTGSIKKAETESGGLKEKLGGISGALGAGFLAGGAIAGVEKVIEAGKQRLEQEEKLKIAVSATGGSEEEQKKKITEATALVEHLASTYAKPKDEVRALVAEISGIGGLSGDQAKKVGEIGIAFNQLGISGRALKGVLLGANDPESTAALDQIKMKFPALAQSILGATDAGSKLDAIYKGIGPTLGGMKEAADGPLGQMAKMEQTGKDLEASMGQLAVGALSPLLPLLQGLAGILNGTVIPVLSATTGFINDNKVAIGVLVGGYLLFRGALAIQEMGGLAASFGKLSSGAIDLGKNILTKLVPGLFASSAAKGVEAGVTGVVTAEQTALNAAMLANPIGLIVLAIAALVGGFILLYNNVKPVHDFVDKLWGNFKIFIAGIKGAVMPVLNGLGESFAGVGDIIDGLIHLDFSKVASGAAKAVSGVKDAYENGMKGAVKGVTEELNNQAEAARKAGEAGKDGAKTAAEAQRDLQKEIQTSRDAYAKGYDDNSKQIAQTTADDVQAREELKTGFAGGVKLQAEDIAQRVKGLEINRVALLDRVKINKQHEKAIEDEKRLTGQIEAKKKPTVDLIALSKSEADEQARKLDIGIRLKAGVENRAVTQKELLSIEQLRTAEFEKQIVANHALANDKGGKKEIKYQAIVDESQIKQLEIEAKIKLDRKKLEEDFEKSLTDLTKKQIEVGIRPKSDGIVLLNQQIDEIKAKLEKATANVKIGDETANKTKIAQLNTELLGLEQQRNKESLDATDTLEQSRLALITDAQQKELAERTFALNKEMQFAQDAFDQKRDLTIQELELQKNLEEKYQRDIVAIHLKYQKDQVKQDEKLDVTAKGVLLDLYKRFTDAKKALDAADYNDKILGFDKERTALAVSLQKGEIGQREYNIKLAKLSHDRSEFERTESDAKNNSLLKKAGTFYDELVGKLRDYVKSAAIQYALDALFHTSAEETKTGATLAGTATRVLANVKEIGSDLAKAGASIVGAVGDVIAWFATIGPWAIPAGIAAGGALIGSFVGLKSLLGFETGGLGITGERGPEIIGPTKDFSEFAVALITRTSQMVEKTLGGTQNSTGRGSRMAMDVNVKGKVAGRDLKYVVDRDGQVQQHEQLVPT
jgi:hypothetical protein